MALTYQECAQAIERMTSKDEHLFLVNAGHWLTVSARAAYEEQGSGARQSIHLRWFNEIHHRIYAQIRSHMAIETEIWRLDGNALALWLTGYEREDDEFRSSCLWAFEQALLSTYAS